MPEDVKLPELGENIESAEVSQVLVSAGDTVKQDQSIVELETDKAAVEVPSPVEGKVLEVLIKKGQKVEVGAVLLRVEAGTNGAKEEEEEKARPKEEKPRKEERKEPKEEPREGKREEKEENPEKEEAPPGKKPGTKKGKKPQPSKEVPVAASPATRRFAREIGIEVSQVPPGEDGRVSINDVKAFAKRLHEGGASSAGPSTAGGAPSLPDFEKWGEVRREKMSSLRKTAAQHLGTAWDQIPHVTQHDEADVTELETLRKKLNKEGGAKFTVTAFVLKVAAEALKRFPNFNASLDIEKSEIIFKEYVHIGVAVDTERGLLVPVIRDADTKSVRELAKELGETAQKARDRKLSVEEMRGASFTITNLGGIGGTAFTPVVNWPEVAILGLSRSKTVPVLRDGQWTPRTILPLSLSYDHRLVDGADAARFLRWVAEALEQPFLLMV